MNKSRNKIQMLSSLMSSFSIKMLNKLSIQDKITLNETIQNQNQNQNE